jgi:glycosyltransferase involved in cell wall biosynthesis
VSAPAPIAWISCVGEKGGAETLMMECLRALDRSKFKPAVVQLRPGPLEGLLQALDVEVHVLETHRMREVGKLAAAILRIRALARRHDWRVIHSNGFRAHVYGGLAARLAGIPEVWTTHTVEASGASTTAICAIPTRCVVANCPRTRDYFVGRRLPTEMAWPPVNASALKLAAARAPRETLATRYGIPAPKAWVTVAARLQHYKGQTHFLRAISALKADPDWHGLIMGGSLFGQETAYQRELHQLCASLGLADRITFTGFVPDDDAAGLLKASTLLVHPALEEDFGLSVAEAQALGVPVVAYAATGPAEIVVPGETGWLVPVGDIPALGVAVADALSSPARLAKFGRTAAPLASERFSADAHARHIESIYRDVASGLKRGEGTKA